jgi:hypothetical protein
MNYIDMSNELLYKTKIAWWNIVLLIFVFSFICLIHPLSNREPISVTRLLLLVGFLAFIYLLSVFSCVSVLVYPDFIVFNYYVLFINIKRVYEFDSISKIKISKVGSSVSISNIEIYQKTKDKLKRHYIPIISSLSLLGLKEVLEKKVTVEFIKAPVK